MIRNEGELNFAFGHNRYKRRVLAMIAEHGLEWRSPYLAKGDVLFWSSRTIHGSLPARERGLSRSSLTAHYLPEGDEMLQFHTRIRRLNLTRYNGMVVGQLHNQDHWRNRLVRRIATGSPVAFEALRKVAIRVLLAIGTVSVFGAQQAASASQQKTTTAPAVEESTGGDPLHRQRSLDEDD